MAESADPDQIPHSAALDLGLTVFSGLSVNSYGKYGSYSVQDPMLVYPCFIIVLTAVLDYGIFLDQTNLDISDNGWEILQLISDSVNQSTIYLFCHQDIRVSGSL